MSDYFDYTTGRLEDGLKARAPVVNAIFDEISAGFDKTITYGTDTGAANAYVVTLPNTIAAYSDGMRVVFKASAANTGAATINVNSIGVKSLTRQSGSVLVAADILAGKVVECIYNSTSGQFELISAYADALLSTVTALSAGSGVKVSSDDTTIGFLDGKLLAGTGAAFTVGSPAGNETLTISVPSLSTALSDISTLQVDSKLNTALINFALIGLYGASFYDMGDGFADEFIDTTGITTATNFNFHAGNYANHYVSGCVNGATYSSQIAIAGNDGRGLFFSYDGTQMYYANSQNDVINQYTLSAPWDITSATSTTSEGVSAQVTTEGGVYIDPSGVVMYVLDITSTAVIYQYTLGTPWDVSTSTYSKSLTPSAVSACRMMMFSPDGKTLIVGGTQTLAQYFLSTAWDLATAINTGKTFSLASQVTDFIATGTIDWDGKDLYVVGNNDYIYQYSLSDPWDVSTASYSNFSFVPTAKTSTPSGIFIKRDGSSLFVRGAAEIKVFSYTFSTSVLAATASLISATVTADTAPTVAYATIIYQPVDAVTINTDLILSVSRDGGSTWTAAVLSEVFSNSTYKVFSASVTISAQPSGTDMKYKIDIANSKRVKIHAASLQWS